ncbi:branched-chain amino acid transport system ATP-binding protein [Cryobacterium mesophilum]|uniref:ATP-binding cassette domain-containing protein n=1 Tax=Terrimesophilobacter mesophilus TaxID=433647 RepID=A0A4R8VGJ5_9MICO|nr:ATP-binding cassette domain-containing protein [Terrimesophilobacter mesophilus]MBB5634020.1 branched-chain amino acid transport system ATP-binding protein [Terrimesophilobacter mesophilus]TFB81370.1 ATP-binding cassette domain-containing protein [Terrimesophilobacter mesophilus]
MSDPILSVRGLSARIAGQQVVEDVTFDVPATGVTALLGRNGVGKTSTIKGVLGLIERRGEVTFRAGGSAVRLDRLRTHRIVQLGIGYVPEDREVFSKLTVAENLRLAERSSDPRREFVAELFPDLVARSNQLAGTLSGGQQQMLSLGRALINTNTLLLVDEPTKGLAPIIVSEVAAALAEAAKTVPVLLVEQNLQVVRQLATDSIVIEGGRVVHTGPAAQLLDDEDMIRRFLGVHGETTGAGATA